jgi:hypothetical protein
MRSVLSLSLFASLAGCAAWDSDPMLAPVRGDAPSAGDLFAQGYRIVDTRPIGIDCPPEEGICDGFDAVYLGIEGSDLAHFACPGITGGLDQWKCRAIARPYLPDGGRRQGRAGTSP